MVIKSDRLRLRIPFLVEADAKGPLAIIAVVAMIFLVLFLRALG